MSCCPQTVPNTFSIIFPCVSFQTDLVQLRGLFGIPLVLEPEISFVGSIEAAAKLNVGVIEELSAEWIVEVGVWGRCGK